MMTKKTRSSALIAESSKTVKTQIILSGTNNFQIDGLKAHETAHTMIDKNTGTKIISCIIIIFWILMTSVSATGTSTF